MTCRKYSFQNLCLLILTAAAVMVPNLDAAEIFLRADTTTITLPGGRQVLMWGFAQDSAFGTHDGTVTVPGPEIVLASTDTELTIHLENNLPEPVSIMIPGQIAPVAPVSFQDDEGRMRIRSFTHETPSGNADPVDYTWTNVREGTYLYQSASHPALQVQMGLYGCMRRNFASNEAYEGVTYDQEVTLLFSEIDPDLHDAVQADDYGPDKTITSTIDYTPRYFLINGEAYTGGQAPLAAGEVNDRVLLRLINAGIEAHVPSLQELRGTVIAEDGYPYAYPRDQYTIDLPPAKTKDVLLVPSAAGTYPLYDHRYRLTNDTASPGGMLVFLDIAEAPANPLDVPKDEVPVPRTGDLNKDGRIDQNDLRLFVQYYQQGSSLSPNPADFNRDGWLTYGDVAIMIQAFLQENERTQQQPPARRPVSPRPATVEPTGKSRPESVRDTNTDRPAPASPRSSRQPASVGDSSRRQSTSEKAAPPPRPARR